MEMTIHLPEVEDLAQRVLVLIDEIRELRQKVMPGKLWYSRTDLAALKGIPVSAFYNKSWLLPPGEPAKHGGVDRWSFKQVWETRWIWKTDKELNPRGGERDGTKTGIQTGNPQPQATVRRVQRIRSGVLSR
jgi:hypothetical protein